MVKRRGFKKFIRSIEGFKRVGYGVPSNVWLKAPTNWRESTVWLVHSFEWSKTPQDSFFWRNIYNNGWTGESKDIIRTWISEGYL